LKGDDFDVDIRQAKRSIFNRNASAIKSVVLLFGLGICTEQ
jgi:hypothetical protein